ncbi:hypothetical protein C5167_006236 [Papaver somniferum]|uniref:Uncharacterized protein n=1 Tax=Papaver somniferum TaxID=3469 RepID=A0A4Y7JFV9_PAPSO|nr:hypothetical protein C5167_006236 [Papaver somniferum]
MAAAKTSLVLFLFALIAISASLQMASAAGVQCATDLSLNLNVLNGCTSDTQCVDLYVTRSAWQSLTSMHQLQLVFLVSYSS